MIVWVIAGLLGLATGLRIGWALVNKQSLVSAAMILALGSLGLVAALNWQPLTLLIDTALGWPNVSTVLSQVALIACAAGSCVMITSASSGRKPATIRRIAIIQYVRRRRHRRVDAGRVLHRAPAARDGPRGVPAPEPGVRRHVAVVVVATALRAARADLGRVGGGAPLQSKSTWPGACSCSPSASR